MEAIATNNEEAVKNMQEPSKTRNSKGHKRKTCGGYGITDLRGN